MPALRPVKRPITHLVALVSRFARGGMKGLVKVGEAVVVEDKFSPFLRLPKRRPRAKREHISREVLRARFAHSRDELLHVLLPLKGHAEHDVRAHAHPLARRQPHRAQRLARGMYPPQRFQALVRERLNAEAYPVHARPFQLERLFAGERFGIALAGKLRALLNDKMLFYACQGGFKRVFRQDGGRSAADIDAVEKTYSLLRKFARVPFKGSGILPRPFCVIDAAEKIAVIANAFAKGDMDIKPRAHLLSNFKMVMNASLGTSTEPIWRMRFFPSFCFSSSFFLRVMSPP